MVATRTLVQIAAWGGVLVGTTAFYLQHVFIDRVRNGDYYKIALKTLRSHSGAVHYLGAPIKDKSFKISDPDNFCNGKLARFCVPVTGTKDKAKYYFWAERKNDDWVLTKAELELQSKSDNKTTYLEVDPFRFLKKMFVGTAKEKFFYHNTLMCLVKALQGKNITLDLRNDSYICGLVTSVDGFMNISFENSVYCDPQGNEFFFEYIFIQARNIRYIHVPDNVSIKETIHKEIKENKPHIPDRKPMEKSRKAKKALRQHMQTVASLEIAKK